MEENKQPVCYPDTALKPRIACPILSDTDTARIRIWKVLSGKYKIANKWIRGRTRDIFGTRPSPQSPLISYPHPLT